MKSFIKKIVRSDFGIKLRNTIGIRPLSLSAGINTKYRFTSISDAFPWRTDNGYKTTFKYSDILGLFYKIEDSYVELVFYSKDNNLIKKIMYKLRLNFT